MIYFSPKDSIIEIYRGGEILPLFFYINAPSDISGPIH